jgi:hypothetical protein
MSGWGDAGVTTLPVSAPAPFVMDANTASTKNDMRTIGESFILISRSAPYAWHTMLAPK